MKLCNAGDSSNCASVGMDPVHGDVSSLVQVNSLMNYLIRLNLHKLSAVTHLAAVPKMMASTILLLKACGSCNRKAPYPVGH